MKDILKKLETVSDPRQQCKVKHSIKDIVGIVLFATLANANEWTEIILFAEENEDFLKQYLDLPNVSLLTIHYLELWESLILSLCNHYIYNGMPILTQMKVKK